MTFEGTYVALVTPFTEDNKVNIEKLKEMVDFHIKNGTDGLVPCGTTGESPTLSWEEHELVIKTVVEAANKRVQVIAGAGSNNTKEAVEATKFAKEVGADAVLSVNPYYNKPTQEGLYQHFKTVAQEGNIPVVVYNIQGRTGVNISTSTMERLMQIENICAVKEASGNMNQISEVITYCGSKLDVLSGDDSMTLPLLSTGGKGVVSVIANILPKELKDIYNAYIQNDVKRAAELHQKMFPLFRAMFLETNPIPIKEAMNMLGWDVGKCRLPLTPMDISLKDKLAGELEAFGLKIKDRG